MNAVAEGGSLRGDCERRPWSVALGLNCVNCVRSSGVQLECSLRGRVPFLGGVELRA